MDVGTGRIPPVRRAGWFALFAVAYVAAGWVGLQVPSLDNAVTLIWAPTGLAIGMVVLFGRAALPVVALASFTVSLLSTRSVGFAAATAIGNAIEAWVAATVFLRLTKGRRDLGRPADAGAYVLACALGCSAASAVGAAAFGAFISGNDSHGSYLAAGRMWWLGDMLGAALVGPVVLVLAAPPVPRGAAALHAWTAWLTVALGVATVALHFAHLSDPGFAVPIALVQMVAIVAATFRFGGRGAHVAALAIASSAVTGTLMGLGPYAAGSRPTDLVTLWSGLALIAGTALLVSSLASEQASAESRVMLSENRLRALFEHAPNGMLLLDSQRRVVLANPAALVMAGRNEFGDGDATRLLVGDESGSLREALRKGTQRGDPIVESTMKRTGDDGVSREYVVRTALIGAPRGFDGAVVLVEDVTAREAARREREDIEQHLAAAQRLDSIGNLAGGIAHDFNNMLQAIQANAELAELAIARGKDASPLVTRVLSAAERATALTRQLLAFSRRQPASFDRVDVVSTMRTALALFERLLPEDIHLLFDPREPELAVRGDQAQIEQIALNLVVNARDAMPHGGTLRIDLEGERFADAPGGLVRLSVTDEGRGVDGTIRDRIFEPFFTTKPTGKGTGIGLAVVYGIAKSHGGSVRVENVQPHGARFIVELPWLDTPSPVTTRSDDAAAPPGTGQQILLVEDDLMVRSAVRDMLAASGYEVSIASNGADAVSCYVDANGKFDAVVLDVVMPVMGGREAYERLRAFDPDVRVIFATGYSEEQIDVGFVLRERVPVLTKPYDRNSLLRAIAECLVREPK